MGLKDVISKIRKENVFLPGVATDGEVKNSRAKVAKAKVEIEKMDNAFWDQLTEKIEFSYRKFLEDKTLVNEAFYEMAKLDFEIEEIRIGGYLAIVERPHEFDFITKTVAEKMSEKKEEKQIMQEILDGEQLKIS